MREKFGHRRAPRLLVACEARLCQKGVLCYFHLSRETTHRRRTLELRPLRSFLGRGRYPAALLRPVASCASCTPATSHDGGRRAMSPLSTTCEPLSPLGVLWPPGECSRAGRMYRSVTAHRGEFTASPSHGSAGRACVCFLLTTAALFPHATVRPRKRHRVVAPYFDCSGFIRTTGPGCLGLRHMCDSPTTRSARLRTPACTAVACNVSRSCAGLCSQLLGSGVMPVPVPRLSRGCQPHHTFGPTRHISLPTWKTNHPIPALEQHATDLARDVFPGVARRAPERAPFPVLVSWALGDPSAGAVPLVNIASPPLRPAPLLQRL